MKDCLIIGFNDSDFPSFVEMVRSMGEDSGAFRDLNLAFVTHGGRPYNSMELLSELRSGDGLPADKLLNNTDFLWPTILYLGSYLDRHGFTFDYVNQFQFDKDLLREKLLAKDVLTIAITTTLYVAPQPILEIISFIRQYDKDVRIIVGGPYVSNLSKLADRDETESIMQYLGADYYVISQEGEAALVQLLTAIKSGGSLDAVDNLAYRDGEGYVFTKTSIERNPLDENMVKYSLFAPEEVGQFVSLRTAKSCPFSCAFCGFPQRAGKYTYLPVELVEKELDAIASLGSVTTLTFLDDTFNIPKKRFKDVLRMMIRNRYDFKWNSFYRSDHGDEEAIELMAEAGCEGVFLGIESGSDVQLGNMRKTARRHHYMKAIPLLRQAGISVHTSFIVGFPGETEDTLRDTISLIEEARPDFFRAQLWYADPVTPIWERRDEFNIQGAAFSWSHDTMDFREASDIVEEMFLSIKNSVWLPQNGFEQWSTFYLQRLGMSMPRIKNYLEHFRAAVKEKLADPGRELAGELLESLRESCRFDGPDDPDHPVLELSSGRRYDAERELWQRDLAGVSPPAALGFLGDPDAGGEGWATVELGVDRDTTAALAGAAAPGALPESLLAAYATVLSRLGGQQDPMLVASSFRIGESPVPVRLEPRWQQTFAEFVDAVGDACRRAGENARYAYRLIDHFLGSGVAPPEQGLSDQAPSRQSLALGFLYREAIEGGRDPGEALESFLRERDLGRRLGLVLVLFDEAGELRGRLAYRASELGEESIELLAQYLTSVTQTVARDPRTVLGDVLLDQPHAAYRAVDPGDAQEVFAF